MYEPFVLNVESDIALARFFEDLADHMLDRGLEQEAKALLFEVSEWEDRNPDPTIEEVVECGYRYYEVLLIGERSPFAPTYRECVATADNIRDANEGVPLSWDREAQAINRLLMDSMPPPESPSKRAFVAFVDDGDTIEDVCMRAILEMAEVDRETARRLALEIGWVAEDPDATVVDYGEVLLSYCRLEAELGSNLRKKLQRAR